MEKRLLWLSVVVMAVALFGSSVLAVDLLGPPCATLKQGQWSTAFEYIYGQQDVDMGTIDDDSYAVEGGDIKSMKVRKAYLNVGYGATDNVQVFGRIGGASTDLKWGPYDWFDADYQFPISGDMGFAWGLGAKATLVDGKYTDWGCLGQISWGRSRERLPGNGLDGVEYDGRAEMDFYEVMFAAGPTHHINDKVAVYGGPFYHIFDGDVTVNYEGGSDWVKFSPDSDSFGGFIGAVFDVSENASLNFEYMYSPEIGAFGASFIWRFQ